MSSEVRAVGVGQARQRPHGVEAERRDGLGGEELRHEDLSIVSEADQPRIESGIPEGREQESIVDIQPQGISLALGPSHNVGSTQ